MKHWRGNFILILFFVFGAALVGRLIFLQVIRHGFFEALAQGQRDPTSIERGERGNIFVQNKQGSILTLATLQKVPFVFLSPPEVKDAQRVVDTLSAVLGIGKETILSKIQQSNSLYEVVKKRLSQTEVQSLKRENLKGVYVGDENVRFYPQQELASQVVGFTNQDGQGQYGVEKYYNSILEGKEGIKNDARNPASYLLSVFSDTMQNGSDITLTIDPNIQATAESLLGEARTALHAQDGTVIVIDPRNGKILALANSPSFNPNDFASVKDFSIFQDSAIEKIFEPGSVFKAITMAGAIDTGSVTPETTYTDKGILQIGGYKIYNYDNRVWDLKSMKDVLNFSINTGAVFAQQQLGNISFLNYVKRFGILEPTNVDLPGEIYSQNKELLQGREINFATASFGQGIEMTPLQLVPAYSALANGGQLVRPYITQDKQPSLSTPIISQETAKTVTSMLVDVVENGYGKAAKIPGYYIAGKTGTAQISWSSLGVAKSGYSDKTVQSFVGYAPAYNPQFLILVKLTNPNTKTAEYSAEPIFKKLAQYIIDYLEIPPDYAVE